MDLCANAWLVFLFISTFHILEIFTQKPLCKIRLKLKLENLAANTSCALGLQWNSKVYEPHCNRAPINGIPFLTNANLQPLKLFPLFWFVSATEKGYFQLFFSWAANESYHFVSHDLFSNRLKPHMRFYPFFSNFGKTTQKTFFSTTLWYFTHIESKTNPPETLSYEFLIRTQFAKILTNVRRNLDAIARNNKHA